MFYCIRFESFVTAFRARKLFGAFEKRAPIGSGNTPCPFNYDQDQGRVKLVMIQKPEL